MKAQIFDSLGGAIIKKEEFISWWKKDHGRPIVVAVTIVAALAIIAWIWYIYIREDDILYFLYSIFISTGLGDIMYRIYPKLYEYISHPKQTLAKIIHWLTNYHYVRISSIILSGLLFFISMFGVFSQDTTLTKAAIIYFSIILAVLGGCIYSFLYSLGMSLIFKRIMKSNKEDDNVKEFKKPKYVTLSWWKKDYYCRFVGVGAFIILTGIGFHILDIASIKSMLGIMEWITFSTPFSIMFAVLGGYIYYLIVAVVVAIYKKIKKKKNE